MLVKTLIMNAILYGLTESIERDYIPHRVRYFNGSRRSFIVSTN
jgi:hypothetical protein